MRNAELIEYCSRLVKPEITESLLAITKIRFKQISALSDMYGILLSVHFSV